jgi:hypothetical protein
MKTERLGRNGGDNIMTYNAPELLLVGAAQNLVLATSGTARKDSICPVQEVHESLGGFDTYEPADNW